jgi:hypothetical protein
MPWEERLSFSAVFLFGNWLFCSWVSDILSPGIECENVIFSDICGGEIGSEIQELISDMVVQCFGGALF